MPELGFVPYWVTLAIIYLVTQNLPNCIRHTSRVFGNRKKLIVNTILIAHNTVKG